MTVRADRVLPGDIVTPTRGRYQGIQCRVEGVMLGKYGTYSISVIPLTPTPAIYAMDYTDQVRVRRDV